MFESYTYDPSIYEKVEEDYRHGKTYKIEKWEWRYNKDAPENERSYKQTMLSATCLTIKDFDERIWDLFADFTEKKTNTYLWGLGGLKHSNPARPLEIYFDGIIFGLTYREFMGCIENKTVSRFLSLLQHFGYEHIELIVN